MEKSKRIFSQNTDRGYEKIIYTDKNIPINNHRDILGIENFGALVHFHTQYEILYCLEGTLQTNCNNEVFAIHEGNAMFIGPYTLHSTFCESECVYECLLIDANFLTSLIDITSNPFYSISDDQRIIEDLKDIIKEYNGKEAYYVDMCKGKFISCFSRLMRSGTIVNLSDAKFNTVFEITQYIEKHYDEKISLQSLCEISNLSTSQLCLVFKQATGISITNYINKIRCQHAYAMIKTGKYTVSEVATICGFNNFSYFSKKYLECIGELPSSSKRKL